jgi:hypothetical protein
MQLIHSSTAFFVALPLEYICSWTFHGYKLADMMMNNTLLTFKLAEIILKHFKRQVMLIK